MKIRTATPEDVDLLVSWAAREGWNPGSDDGAAFLAADPEGFLVGCLEAEPVTGISAVRYGDDFGFIGFYICAPDHRGQGHGRALWTAAMDRLGNRTVGLDGVVDQQDNYRKSGFTLTHRNIRQSGLSTVDAPADPRLTLAGKGMLPALRAMDRQFFGFDRTAFLEAWLDPMADTRKSFAVVEDGTLQGFGTIRQCEDGYKIGPLFAQTPEVADLLFRALAGQVKGQTVILDTPEPNAAALALAERHDLSPVFETARMYRGQAPDLPLARIFGITTFELG
ncbi:GNAT family N-acetyltransferase [Roseibium aestuarii]|uniref:GNAT family N-acetyltransferase n=1 Tax=Roseibium aestuarii TaxID=2600299 RepID=A0ABW4JS52_9HYPH|nr:GNAT family N-acetyltransferase [Roseibium aestuarii]